ncbi:hypothetical protein GCM10025864_20290 [Luteimicrobium album]|uniref:beta-N-acetylhexosaminidase n=1 Tax=Luteimicrobium album TaxID=1054550 RepID=A0ABQ6I3A3_9MICO|nr:family 20 glycosylhydrolase [Luteimicrobium album]GMA24270.1 hypothetical protein GCM10025864_20290 [Luteimicrobium album]
MPPPWELPCGTVRDEPAFAWRGVLLDVVRHFLPVREVLRFVDLMAAHRLNTLQLHLTDDQGWRLEIDGFPALTAVASWRRASQVGAGDDAPDDGRPHGGYYTRADVAEIVAYAAERHVTVVPEIDLPGHVQALLAAYPELGAGLDRAPDGRPVAPEVWTRWGISDHVLGLSEHVVETVGAILDDVLDQFPGPVLALGGDESPKVRWHADPDVVRRRAELGLDRDADAQNWLLDWLAQRARVRGRRVLLWDEVLEGAPVRGAVVASWRGSHGVATGLAQGYDVVAAPADEVYLDYRESDDPREPVPVGVVTDVDRVLRFDPRRGVTGDESGRLLGAQAHLWTEHLDSPRALDYRVFPRLAAFAEVVWRGAPSDPDDFRERLAVHERRLEAWGSSCGAPTVRGPGRSAPASPARRSSGTSSTRTCVGWWDSAPPDRDAAPRPRTRSGARRTAGPSGRTSSGDPRTGGAAWSEAWPGPGLDRTTTRERFAPTDDQGSPEGPAMTISITATTNGSCSPARSAGRRTPTCGCASTAPRGPGRTASPWVSGCTRRPARCRRDGTPSTSARRTPRGSRSPRPPMSSGCSRAAEAGFVDDVGVVVGGKYRARSPAILCGRAVGPP